VKPRTVWIVVPAFNEGTIVRSVINPLIDEHYNVVVVDDGSTDETFAEACHAGAYVCRHTANLGQGAALQTGIQYALSKGAAHIVTFDADAQHDHTDIPKLLEPLGTGDFDVALGTRFGREGQAPEFPSSRKALLKLATLYTRLTLRMKITDTHNGLRAFTAQAATQLNITQNRMAHASQILGQVRSHRMRYIEVPVTVQYTEYSTAKGQKVSNIINILWDSFTELIRR